MSVIHLQCMTHTEMVFIRGYWLRDANNTVIASMQMLGAYTSEQRTNFETGTAPPPPPRDRGTV